MKETPMPSWNPASAEFFRYNPFLAKLRNRLEKLEPIKRAAFAAFCATHLSRHFMSYAKAFALRDASTFEHILDRLWEHVLGSSLSGTESARLMEQIEAIDLGNVEQCEAWDAAVDAVGALWLAADACSSGSPEMAARAAGNVINRVHQALIDEFRANDPRTKPREAAALLQKILIHPRTKVAKKFLEDQISFLESLVRVSTPHVGHLKSQALCEVWSQRG